MIQESRFDDLQSDPGELFNITTHLLGLVMLHTIPLHYITDSTLLSVSLRSPNHVQHRSFYPPFMAPTTIILGRQVLNRQADRLADIPHFTTGCGAD